MASTCRTIDEDAFEKLMKVVRERRVDLKKITITLNTEMESEINQTDLNDLLREDKYIALNQKLNIQLVGRGGNVGEFCVKVDFPVFFMFEETNHLKYLTIQRCDFERSIKPILNAIKYVVQRSAQIDVSLIVSGEFYYEGDDFRDDENDNSALSSDFSEYYTYFDNGHYFPTGRTEFDIDGKPLK